MLRLADLLAQDGPVILSVKNAPRRAMLFGATMKFRAGGAGVVSSQTASTLQAGGKCRLGVVWGLERVARLCPHRTQSF